MIIAIILLKTVIHICSITLECPVILLSDVDTFFGEFISANFEMYSLLKREFTLLFQKFNNAAAN